MKSLALVPVRPTWRQDRTLGGTPERLSRLLTEASSRSLQDALNYLDTPD